MQVLASRIVAMGLRKSLSRVPSDQETPRTFFPLGRKHTPRAAAILKGRRLYTPRPRTQTGKCSKDSGLWTIFRKLRLNIRTPNI